MRFDTRKPPPTRPNPHNPLSAPPSTGRLGHGSWETKPQPEHENLQSRTNRHARRSLGCRRPEHHAVDSVSRPATCVTSTRNSRDAARPAHLPHPQNHHRRPPRPPLGESAGMRLGNTSHEFASTPCAPFSPSSPTRSASPWHRPSPASTMRPEARVWSEFAFISRARRRRATVAPCSHQCHLRSCMTGNNRSRYLVIHFRAISHAPMGPQAGKARHGVAIALCVICRRVPWQCAAALARTALHTHVDCSGWPSRLADWPLRMR